MSENLGFLLRVKYAKRGRLAFLSHLETIRSMERIIRRARLPYALSEGFNPHMKISFGPALPCGAAGYGEYLDVRLREYVKPDVALERMLKGSVSDLTPLSCEYIDVRAESVSVAFPLSVWRAEFMDADIDALKAAFARLVERGYIEIERKSKKRRHQMEIKQVPLEGRLVDGPSFALENGNVVIDFKTMAQAQGSSLRPDKFIAAALEFLDPGERPRLLSLARTELRQVTQPEGE